MTLGGADEEVVASASLVLGLLVGLSYYVGMHGWRGATLGKMALGIRVARIDGSSIGYGVALTRYVLMVVLAFVPFGIAYLVMVDHPRRQCWHDRAVGTVVIHAR